ncbi:MAG: pitrilysin family protein [Bacilli bacterium]|nr:insulinase family protein [Mollicutes bacterium]MDY3899352.1 pitrilysin family protein [Bacilli bacterium]
MKLTINNENIYFEQTDKYKTIAIGVMMFTPFKKEYLAEKTLLSSMMIKVNSEFPNEQEFNIHCQELYDMGISMRSGRVGRMGVVSLSLTVVNPLYLKEKVDLLEETVNLMKTILLKPHFTSELLEQEKRLLINELEGVYNNKNQYASQQFVKTMFKNELLSIKTTGEIEDIKNVTIDSLKKAYQEILTYPRVFYVIGGVEKTKVEKLFSDFTSYNVNSEINSDYFIDKETKEITEVTKVIEVQNINQSILYMGYRTNIRIDDTLYTAAILFTGMLGQFFHSSLFQVIREEHSLAYYVGSDYNPRKGNLAVIAGIDAKSYDEVIKLVNEIIDNYQKGNFEDEILELTKKAYINQLKKQEDFPGSFINNIYTELANAKVLSLDEKIKAINNITKEDIITVSKALTLDTIYFLKGDQNEKN